MMAETYIDTREAAKVLGVSRKKVRAMARAGKIIGHKTGAAAGLKGRDWRLDKRSIIAMLAQFRTQTSTKSQTDSRPPSTRQARSNDETL